MTSISFDAVEVGTELPPHRFTVTRADLIRYAGASGDFNVIHWNERIARSVGLPDVIAHGMLTMALAGRYVGAWCGDAGAIVDYRVRFSRPVVVPDDDAGTELSMTGTVIEKIAPDRVIVSLSATSGGQDALSNAQVELRLPSYTHDHA